VEKVARYDEAKVSSMLLDPGIIRNRKKIESSINNAQRFLEIQEKYASFCNYIWGFVDGKQVVNRYKELSEIPATTAVSDAMAKDMKQRGFRFLGSTILYAHMQATGLVNDHLLSCFRHEECKEE
jgi:DNA-3-methyladenine glycosylase I